MLKKILRIGLPIILINMMFGITEIVDVISLNF
jgi:hypothetical protein